MSSAARALASRRRHGALARAARFAVPERRGAFSAGRAARHAVCVGSARGGHHGGGASPGRVHASKLGHCNKRAARCARR